MISCVCFRPDVAVEVLMQNPCSMLGVHARGRQVRCIVEKHLEDSREAFNDAQEFLAHLQRSKAHLWFRADNQSRITSIAWASDVQKAAAVRFHSVIITDTTFNTNRCVLAFCMVQSVGVCILSSERYRWRPSGRLLFCPPLCHPHTPTISACCAGRRHPPPTRYKFSLALVVVVDHENHSQIVMQALLSNERQESFQFVYESLKELCEGGSPKVKQLNHLC